MEPKSVRQTVVVGVDGSECGLRATRWGAAEAARRQVPLRLVIASGATVDYFAARADLDGRYRDELITHSRAHLAAAGEVARGMDLGIEVQEQLVVGSPIQVLGAEARQAQLLVIGDRGLSHVGGLLVGSVAIALSSHAACPVVVVRGDERADAASLPVLVGVDGSPTSDAALGFAFEAAAARKVPLTVGHTWSDMIYDRSLLAVEINWDAVESDERRVLSEQVGVWADKFPNVAVELLVTRDQPAHSLIEQAARAQLVVVGSRGHGQFVGMILGSVSNALLHRSPCPVAVVRPETAPA